MPGMISVFWSHTLRVLLLLYGIMPVGSFLVCEGLYAIMGSEYIEVLREDEFLQGSDF